MNDRKLINEHNYVIQFATNRVNSQKHHNRFSLNLQSRQSSQTMF